MSVRTAGLVVLLVAVPRVALAHGSIQGMGSFYGGMLHPFLVPAHVLVLLSLGLFLGQQAIVDLPTGFPAFMGGLSVGLLIAVAGALSVPTPVVLAVAAALGVVVAAAFPVPSALCAVLTVGAGLVVGVDSPPEVVTMGGRAAAVIGTALAAILAVFYTAAAVERLRRDWQRILVRVLGSWICASASLVLALALAGKG